MFKRLRGPLLLAITLIAGGAAAAHLALQALIAGADFRSLAETKVGEILQADVRIGDIQPGFLNRVRLKGLVIDTGKTEPQGFQLEVDEIDFRYGLFQLLTRNLMSPASVVFRAPKLFFQKSEFPFAIFQRLQLKPGSGHAARLDFEGGELRYPLPGFKVPLVLKEMRGSLRAGVTGKVQVRFRAQADGFLKGPVQGEGVVDVLGRTYVFEAALKDLSLDDSVPLPLKNLSGGLRFENGDVFLQDVQAKVHGWDSLLVGSLRRLTGEPTVDLSVQIGKAKEVGRVRLLADFPSRKLEGEVRGSGGRVWSFGGTLRREGLRVFSDPLVINRAYEGSGHLDFDSGDYQLRVSNGNQRFGVHSNLKGLDFRLAVALDHFKWNGLDIVTSARIHLMPLEGALLSGQDWRFRGSYETDYFVLEYSLFDDFQGTFEMDPRGIRSLRGTWGGSFELEGDISFQTRPAEGRLVLQISEFDLKDVRHFAARPLPKSLGGLLDGKLKIDGPLNRPELTGDFGIRDGWLGKLDFDRGILHFRGFAPYLPFEDSRLMRGRTTLSIQGAIDLSLENVLHGIQIQSTDKIVIWRGWEVSASREEGDFEIEQILGREIPTLALKPGLERGGAAAGDTEERREERSVTVGPKIRF